MLALELPMRFELGLELAVPPELDTDALGTFSGDVARCGTPEQTCLQKARLGMAATGLSLGLATEGSFGPHPAMPFIAAHIEVMTFVDNHRGLVVCESVISDKTNYGQRETRCVDGLGEWLATVGFPSHALIVRPASDAIGMAAEKGIVSLDRLGDAIEAVARESEDGLVRVETDMRAHVNPTRLQVIQRLGFRLARRMSRPCPSCGAPGWGRAGTVAGLPCDICDEPTSMMKSELFACARCTYREERPRADDLRTAPPQYCPGCNP